jgi:hypothetical protein
MLAYDSEELRPFKAADITKDHIADIFATVAERAPIQTNQLRTCLHACFTFGLTCKSLTRWRKKAPDFRLMHNPVDIPTRPRPRGGVFISSRYEQSNLGWAPALS